MVRTSTRRLTALHANAMAGDAGANAGALATRLGTFCNLQRSDREMNRIFTAAFIIISLQKQQEQLQKQESNNHGINANIISLNVARREVERRSAKGI